MARNSFNQIQSAPMRRRPMNPFIVPAVLLALIVGALFLFASLAKPQPIRPIETDVASAPVAR